jgi:OmpA-OmpF porin, OOP family
VRSLMAAIVAASLVCGGLPAFAQGNPSADQIIKSLRPSGDPVHGATRGLRLGASPGAAAAAAAPSVNLTVNFATGSAELTSDAIRALDELGRAFASKELAGYRFRIEGHTDTVGSREYNQALSERRAAVVVDYVSRKYGVDQNKLEAVGMGEDGLLVVTPPETPEPRNRRVQVINLGT